MRVHFILNDGGTPAAKLADVEIHFDEGILAGMKLVGCSVWRSRRGDRPSVLFPSRSYATAGGIRYFDLLRPSTDGNMNPTGEERRSANQLKDFIRTEYERIVSSRRQTA